jgi:hypothetical protein
MGPIHVWRSRMPNGVRWAHFPSVITTVMDQKVQLLKPLNLRELFTVPRSRTILQHIACDVRYPNRIPRSNYTIHFSLIFAFSCENRFFAIIRLLWPRLWSSESVTVTFEFFCNCYHGNCLQWTYFSVRYGVVMCKKNYYAESCWHSFEVHRLRAQIYLQRSG